MSSVSSGTTRQNPVHKQPDLAYQDASVVPCVKSMHKFIMRVVDFVSSQNHDFERTYSSNDKNEMYLVEISKDGAWTSINVTHQRLMGDKAFTGLPYSSITPSIYLHPPYQIEKKIKLTYKHLNAKRMELVGFEAWGMEFKVKTEYSKQKGFQAYVQGLNSDTSSPEPRFNLHLVFTTEDQPFYTHLMEKDFQFLRKSKGGTLVKTSDKETILRYRKLQLHVVLTIASLPRLKCVYDAAVKKAETTGKREVSHQEFLEQEVELATSKYIEAPADPSEEDLAQVKELEAIVKRYKERKENSQEKTLRAEAFVNKKDALYPWEGTIQSTSLRLKIKKNSSMHELLLAASNQGSLHTKVRQKRTEIFGEGFISPPFSFTKPPPPKKALSLDDSEEELCGALDQSGEGATLINSNPPPRKRRKRRPPMVSSDQVKRLQWPPKQKDHQHEDVPMFIRLFTNLIVPEGKDHSQFKKFLLLPTNNYLFAPNHTVSINKGNNPFTAKPQVPPNGVTATFLFCRRTSTDLEQRLVLIKDLDRDFKERTRELAALSKDLVTSHQEGFETTFAYAKNHQEKREEDVQKMSALRKKQKTRVLEHDVSVELELTYSIQPVEGQYSPEDGIKGLF